jgi:glycosyltransferase involved in cell wall biosynthesis
MINLNSPTLGVVAIAYNEEEDLPGFLANLLPWVDEIVLVDDGSKDSTKALAQAHPGKVKFIESPRAEGEYYAHQRNKGIAAAESDWLLHMDVDERVTPALALEIKQALQNKQRAAYRFRRLNYFLHQPMQGGGWADWNLVHLAKREVLRFGGMFHETIHLSAADTEIGQLAERMHHFNDATYDERLGKSAKYQKEVAAQIRKSGKKITSLALLKAFVKEFIYKYFYKKGYKDGTLGVLSAMHSACASFKSTALIWDEQNRIARSSLEESLQQDWQKQKPFANG